MPVPNPFLEKMPPPLGGEGLHPGEGVDAPLSLGQDLGVEVGSINLDLGEVLPGEKRS